MLLNPAAAQDESSTTTAKLDQAEEDILTYTVSDEALEAPAAGTCSLGTYSFGQAFCCP
jgi:hypothetical protein